MMDVGSSLPFGVTATLVGGRTIIWPSTTTASRGARGPAQWNDSDRLVLGLRYFLVDVDITDGQAYNLELYVLDYAASDRSEEIQIENAGTGMSKRRKRRELRGRGVLELEDFGQCVHHVQYRPSNAVLSGMFFDPVSAPRSPRRPALARR